MSNTVRFTVDGVVYELEVESFTRGSHGSHFDPPEPGEVELADEVAFDGGTITLTQLIERIAASRIVPLEVAAQILFEEAYEQTERYQDDMSDDVLENERRYGDGE